MAMAVALLLPPAVPRCRSAMMKSLVHCNGYAVIPCTAELRNSYTRVALSLRPCTSWKSWSSSSYGRQAACTLAFAQFFSDRRTVYSFTRKFRLSSSSSSCDAAAHRVASFELPSSQRGQAGLGSSSSSRREEESRGRRSVSSFGTETSSVFKPADSEAAGEGNDGEGSDTGGGGGGDGGGGGGEALGWITSALVFAFYAALLYYVAVLAPGQTPYRDQYFVEKLVGLRADDGFTMNTVLVCEFYIMGLWPLVYSSLLIPSGRSGKWAVPVWPFLILSFGIGAFALVPYFALWQPPPPLVAKGELQKWPLNLLENKLSSLGILLSGVGLIGAAAFAGNGAWTEILQYFRESKFIHTMSVDFLTLSSLAPFWVYNDMTTRKWLDKGFWLLPVSLFPFIGPALYLVLRPPLPLSIIKEEN
ncbi:unnamed protein product [Sphagnum compactum]